MDVSDLHMKSLLKFLTFRREVSKNLRYMQGIQRDTKYCCVFQNAKKNFGLEQNFFETLLKKKQEVIFGRFCNNFSI